MECHPVRRLPRTFFRSVSLLAGVLLALPLAAQTENSVLTPLADTIADKVLKAARREKTAKLLVADFCAKGGGVTPLGTHLADKFSEALSKHAPNLTVMPRTEFLKSLKTQWIVPADFRNPLVARYLAFAAGVQFVVLGIHSRSGDSIELRLKVISTKNGETVGEVKQVIPLDLDEKNLLGRAMPESSEYENAGMRLPKAGVGGYTEPNCETCPQPPFTQEARDAKASGDVILRVLVEPDGSVRILAVLLGASFGLTKQAAQAVSKWKLKPARGPDGKPAAVAMDIEVVFRLL